MWVYPPTTQHLDRSSTDGAQGVFDCARVASLYAPYLYVSYLLFFENCHCKSDCRSIKSHSPEECRTRPQPKGTFQRHSVFPGPGAEPCRRQLRSAPGPKAPRRVWLCCSFSVSTSSVSTSPQHFPLRTSPPQVTQSAGNPNICFFL